MHYSQQRASEVEELRFSSFFFQTEPQIQFSTFPARKKGKSFGNSQEKREKKSLKVKTDRYANRSKKGSLRSLEHIQEVFPGVSKG